MMQRTQIYLPQRQLVKLRERARNEDATISEVIRLLIEEGIGVRKKPRKQKHESLSVAARRIGCIGKRAPRDLAKNLDHYLYGSI